MREVMFSYLSDRVARGSYLGVEVIMLRENGYVHGASVAALGRTRATKSGKGGKPKRLEHWLDTQPAREAIDTCTAALVTFRAQKTPSIIYVNDLPNPQRGAYLHPDLVPLLAAWASPALGVRISRVVNAFAAERMLEHHRRSLAAVDSTMRHALSERDAAIERVRRATEESESLTGRIEKMRAEHERLVAELKAENGALSDGLGEARERKRMLKSMLSDAGDDYNCLSSKYEEAEARADRVETELGYATETIHYHRKKVEDAAEELESVEEEVERLRKRCRAYATDVLSLPKPLIAKKALVTLVSRARDELGLESLPDGQPRFLLFLGEVMDVGPRYKAVIDEPAEIADLLDAVQRGGDWYSHASLKCSIERWMTLWKRLIHEGKAVEWHSSDPTTQLFRLVPPYTQEMLEKDLE